MDADAAALAAQVMPYVTAALSTYGTAVLTHIQDDAADATVNLGRRILHMIFGRRSYNQVIPEPLADLTADPQDADAAAALRLHMRKVLASNPALRNDITAMLTSTEISITTVGPRSAAAQANTGIIATGDNTTIHQHRTP